MSNDTVPAELVDLPRGAWIFKDGRRVTFLGIDPRGNWVDYAEGWVDIRSSHPSNFSVSAPKAE